MAEYKKVFKCCLCGEVFVSGYVRSEYAVRDAFTFSKVWEIIEPHNCENGDVGVAKFQGFKKVGEYD